MSLMDANNNIICCYGKIIISHFELCFISPKKSTILPASLKTQILFFPIYIQTGWCPCTSQWVYQI